MPSLSDLSQGLGGDMVAYRQYVINCGEKGQTPLPYKDWVAAGKPSGL